MPTPTITQGMKGTLQFLPTQAGLDPATITDIKWSQQGPPTNVKFTQPDQVEGVQPGTGSFTCTVTCGPSERMTYKFQVECVPSGPPPPPVNVPIMIAMQSPLPPHPRESRQP
jgi:hypothetical protein